MEVSHHIAVDQRAASNVNFSTDDMPIIPGSSIRMMVAITAIAGAPASNFFLEGRTQFGDYVTLATIALAVVGSNTVQVENCPRRVRYRLAQAGGANTITASVDFIIQPPDNRP